MTIKTANYSTLTHWLQEFTCMPAHTSFIFIQLVRHIIHSSNKNQNGYILVSVNPGPPGKWLLKQGKRERERERERETDRQTQRTRKGCLNSQCVKRKLYCSNFKHCHLFKYRWHVTACEHHSFSTYSVTHIIITMGSTTQYCMWCISITFTMQLNSNVQCKSKNAYTYLSNTMYVYAFRMTQTYRCMPPTFRLLAIIAILSKFSKIC